MAEGEAWQAAYQQYEADRIAAGEDPEAPEFYAAFERAHGSIATPAGAEDTLRVRTRRAPGDHVVGPHREMRSVLLQSSYGNDQTRISGYETPDDRPRQLVDRK